MVAVLTEKERKNCVVVFILILFGGFLELFGISAILPVVQIIIAPDAIKNEPIYISITRFTGIDSDKKFILILSVGVMLLYVFKNLYLTYSTYRQSRLVADIRSTMSEKSLRVYMQNKYSFFVNENSSIIMRGLTTDIDAYLNTLQNYFNIGVRLINVVLICIWLMCTDILLTLVVVVLGVIALGIITGALKRKMRTLGMTKRKAEGDVLRSIAQIVSGIKEVKVLEKDDYFISFFGDIVKKRCSVDVGYTTLSPCAERIIETVFIGGLIVTVGLLAYFGRIDDQFVASLGIFAVACFRMLPFVSQLSSCINTMMYSYASTTAALENIRGTLEGEPRHVNRG